MFKLCLIAACAVAVSGARLSRPSNGYGPPPSQSQNGGSRSTGNGPNSNYAAPAQSNGGSGNGGPRDNYGAPAANNRGNGNGGPRDNYGAPSGTGFTGASSVNNDRYNNGGEGFGAEQAGDLADLIPGGGSPGEDFPVLSSVPDTGFLCEDQAVSGYYADDAQEAGCQVFHICQLRESGQVQQDSFLCPNGTIFNQQYLVCDWWYNFDCSSAQEFYSVNEQIGVASESGDGAGPGYGNSAVASTSNNNGYPRGSNGGASSANVSGYSSGNSGNGRKGNQNSGYSNGGNGGGRQSGGGY